MLKEVLQVEQTDPELVRRWFVGSYFELILWTNADGAIVEFQLCYDRGKNERALIWKHDERYIHQQVDDGEHAGKRKATPILVPDGVFEKDAVAQRFRQQSAAIDKQLADFVYQRLLGYLA